MSIFFFSNFYTKINRIKGLSDKKVFLEVPLRKKEAKMKRVGLNSFNTIQNLSFKNNPAVSDKEVAKTIEKPYPESRIATVDNVYLKGEVNASHKKIYYQDHLFQRIYHNQNMFDKMKTLMGLRNITRLFIPELIRRGLNEDNPPLNHLAIDNLKYVHNPETLVFDHIHRLKNLPAGMEKMKLEKMKEVINDAIASKKQSINFFKHDLECINNRLEELR